MYFEPHVRAPHMFEALPLLSCSQEAWEIYKVLVVLLIIYVEQKP